MDKYNHKIIESKWQEIWDKSDLYRADDNSELEKKYILDMFPYPSGAGLHVGHVEGYTATDIYSRFLRMQGKYNVMHPMGWDAFGLPAENYAIKTGTHPDKSTHDNIKTFIRQLKSLGFSFDWERELDSSSPEYYRWTQWFFLLLYKNNLAYKKKAQVNWCESCQTVLANEQAEGGKCERCENLVIQKDLEQWFFKITDFIEDGEYEGRQVKGLLSGLEKLDWPESTKSAQKNWIGKSIGAEVDFKIVSETVTVFTTRPDTLFGATYFVLSPEHPVIKKYKSQITNYDKVKAYVNKARAKTELERTDLAKEKTGVELKGIKAVNPVNNEAIPVWVADYVMMGYGTGAIMAVPAHDERDFEFAKKFGLLIKDVVAPYYKFDIREEKETEKREVVTAIVNNPKTNQYLCLDWKTTEWKSFPSGGVEGDDLVEEAKREVKEETGYKNLRFIRQVKGSVFTDFYRPHKDSNVEAHFQYLLFELENEEMVEVDEKEKKQHEAVWVGKDDVESYINVWNQKFIWKRINDGDTAYCESGKSVNSDFLDGLKTSDAKQKIIKWLEEKKLGKQAVNYKMRDWLVSRQRYWGAPIPIIYCEKCGEVPVEEKDLPVELPTDVDFKPTGESPLNFSKTFHDVKCPKCGQPARRESDTMDTFVCSSWYYLRFTDPNNDKVFADKKLLKKWLPVDTYVGGAEHTVLHLLYSRFFTKVLHKYGLIDFNEPFTKLRHQGIILAEDMTKMSKSKGNVINPDDVVEQYGADALRMYEMFMGPLEDMKPWNVKGIVGVRRFLDKVWRLREKICANDRTNLNESRIQRSIHKTIKKVTEDIEAFKFNTAISQMMIFVNKLDKGKEINQELFERFLLVLSPFAPHFTEELWSELGHKESIFREQWPLYNKELVKDDKIQLVLQINGKVRDVVEVETGISKIEAIKIARDSGKIKKWTEDKKIVKEIFVKNKLVNIVLR